MRVMLDKEFGIKSDSNNFTVFQLVERTKKDTNEKYEVDNDLGYYGELKQALKGYAKYTTRLDGSINDIKSLENKLDNICNAIELLVEEDIYK